MLLLHDLFDLPQRLPFRDIEKLYGDFMLVPVGTIHPDRI